MPSQISIHALLAESDSAPRFTPAASRNFYPRSPCGERPTMIDQGANSHGISIHALLAESDNGRMRDAENLTISIHALLAESDRHESADDMFRHHFYPRSPCGERQSFGNSCTQAVPISIHALLAESDAKNTSIAGRITSFLSTLSLRRATCPLFFSCWLLAYFYPRSPCGERRECWTALNRLSRFLSTLSLRRATAHYDNYNLHCVISIHALLAESDRAL